MIRLAKVMLVPENKSFHKELAFKCTFGNFLTSIKDNCFQISKEKDIYIDPSCLHKYIVRKHFCVNFKGEEVTLEELNLTDKYSMTDAEIFCGKFEYNKELGGFVPLGKKRRLSIWLAKVYDDIEHKAIHREWGRIKESLSDSAMLIDVCNDQHVYFMRNLETGGIKIGISAHPEIRRSQLKRQEGADLEILHIIPSAGREEEKRLHKKFSNFRIRGEWFEPHESLVDYISSLRGEEAQQ